VDDRGAVSGRECVRAGVIGAGLALLLAALALPGLLAASRSASGRPMAREGDDHASVPAVDDALGRAPREVTPRAKTTPAAVTPRDHAPPVFAGPGPDDPAGPGMLPHPITAEHLRMYRDVELLDAAWQALKSRDFARARALLKTHATEYAAGYDDMQDGLTLLADCMQYPSATSRGRAARFYAERTASSMRRRIRTHCLQAP